MSFLAWGKYYLLNMKNVKGIFIVINGVTVNNKRSINSLLLVIRHCCFLCTEWQFVREWPGQHLTAKLQKTCSHDKQAASMMGFSSESDCSTLLGSMQRKKVSYESLMKQYVTCCLKIRFGSQSHHSHHHYWFWKIQPANLKQEWKFMSCHASAANTYVLRTGSESYFSYSFSTEIVFQYRERGRDILYFNFKEG